jgi:MFS family permease
MIRFSVALSDLFDRLGDLLDRPEATDSPYPQRVPVTTLSTFTRIRSLPRLRRLLGADALRLESWLARLHRRLGGPARTRAIVLFACVLALDTADLASLGAVASRLKPALHLDNTQLGMLAAAPPLVAAIATLPLGVLADRVRRVPVLAGAIGLWAAAMLLSGACGSFGEMLAVRMFLGLATAASAPLLASLVGDLFWPGERGRIYGYILSGQLLGSGLGLVAAGNLAGVSWRLALWMLALPSAVVAVAIWRLLPEPARGGASRLAPGASRIRAAEEVPDAEQRTGTRKRRGRGQPHAAQRDPAVKRAVEQARAQPRRDLVLKRDPAKMTLWQAVAYVLRLRTNLLLIVASALGYFFQAGVNTFGVVFVIARFDASQSEATSLLAIVAVGALAGTVLGGRLADRLLGEGHVSARMVVGGAAFIISSLVFAFGLLTGNLLLALPLYILAAAALGAPNAPLDAARLDIVPAGLWGRAEAIRTVLRTLAVAAAPLLFGIVSDELASGPRSSTKGLGYHASGPGLKYTFLLMLAPMAAGGLLLLRGARSYPRDVATALESDERQG